MKPQGTLGTTTDPGCNMFLTRLPPPRANIYPQMLLVEAATWWRREAPLTALAVSEKGRWLGASRVPAHCQPGNKASRRYRSFS
jgi:hypothetical protein